MKTKLETLRNEIDKIDKEMLDLFINRMKCIEQIAMLKQENNIPIFDSSREKLIKSRFTIDQEFNAYYQEFIKTILKISKEYQKSLINYKE